MKKKLLFNTSSALVNQFIMLISSFILPRLILKNYGSDVNGLITSITQFLGFIALTEMGIGAVVQSSLFVPLANGDIIAISRIIKSTKNFFRKITFVLVLYIVLLCMLFPQIISTTFEATFIVPLIIAISISTIAQYLFGISNQILLNADQRSYIHLLLNAVAILFNTIICAFLMKSGYSIQIVKFVASMVLLIKPIGMCAYVKKNYQIDRNVILIGEPIQQKWNGIAQHFAAFILSNTDVVVLTFFSTMKNVSVYNIYYMVVAGVRQIITTAMTGVDALFGNLYAKKDAKLGQVFDTYELFIHSLVILVFSVTALLICPFISIYTRGINDANYIQPYFGILLAMAYGAYGLRLPYNTMIMAAGHYKQTQNSAIIESVLNIVISVILVKRMGLYGVAVGTLVAMIYRTVYLAYYLSKAILYRSFSAFIRHLIIDTSLIGLVFFSCRWMIEYPLTYGGWFLLAIKILGISLGEVMIVNILFYRNQSKMLIRLFFKKVSRH